MSVTNVASNSEHMKHTTDIVSEIMQYLHFHEIFDILTVCKSWKETCDFSFFNRLCILRNEYSPIDYGKGESVPFNLQVYHTGNVWQKHIIARERIQHLLQNNSTNQLDHILNFCYNNTQTEFQVEGWRILTEIFDVKTVTNSNYITPKITNPNFIKQIIHHINKFDSNHTQIAVKTLGMLCINESNRKRFAEMQCIPTLLSTLSIYSHNKLLIACILWSLVTVSRPYGGIEAEVFHRDEEEHTSNIRQLQQLKCVDLLFFIATNHPNKPLILAKIFWLFVNLSLLDEIKECIVRKDSIKLICNSLKLYPNNKELQYRAIFAIVNLGTHSLVKEKIVEENGIPLILQAIQRYTNDTKFLKMCINAIRALASRSQTIIDQLISRNAAEMFRDLVQRYESDCKSLSHLALHTIHAFDI
eukprot:125427_1